MDLEVGMEVTGEAGTFEAVYRQFAHPLVRYLTRLCGNVDVAEDLVQETFRKAYIALPCMPPDLAVRPWLYAIATNTARSLARAAYWRRVRTFGDEALALIDDRASTEERLVASDLIQHALRRLKPDDAMILLLHWHEGFSIDEVSAVLGISRDALKKRLYRSKKAFSAAYAAESADPKGETIRERVVRPHRPGASG